MSTELTLYLRIVLYGMAALGAFLMAMLEREKHFFPGVWLNLGAGFLFIVLGTVAITAPESHWYPFPPESWAQLRAVGLTVGVCVIIPAQWTVLFYRVKGRRS